MKKDIAKYFWDLNKAALRETEKILTNPYHPKFFARLVTFLSRCDKPKELFLLISKKDFIRLWPKARSYWIKIARESDFRDWWETIYEQISAGSAARRKVNKGKPSVLFLNIGMTIRNMRVQKKLSQTELASTVGMKQPDLSKIEEGKKNITLATLTSLCRALGIKKLTL
ncbi:MAG: hypothetical protein A3K83_03775 [Omnitrophica WOR_2 bacterium RBG_13_44_8b]|nr:MAG: hypothetical protein A3K83_03775 [Omnitrophica WOR_2 bacterium RBG_13_44_8b]